MSACGFVSKGSLPDCRLRQPRLSYARSALCKFSGLLIPPQRRTLWRRPSCSSRSPDLAAATMLVFHTPLSLLHDPPYEILSGCAQPYLESPDRIALILSSLLKERNEDPAVSFEERRCDWTRDDVASDAALFEAVARVHDREYLDFLREIYEDWVAEGGSKVPCAPLFDLGSGLC